MARAVWTSSTLFVEGAMCPYCDKGCTEDLHHMWWECSAWAQIRHEYTTPFHAFSSGWPSCFRCCGIMPQDHPAFNHLELTANQSDSSGSEYGHEMPAYLRQTWTHDLMVDRRVVVFTDGASTRNQDARLRRAGVGVFWGREHPKNISFPLDGPRQTNQRAELVAVKLALTHETRPLEIRSDSQYVVDGCTKYLPKWRRENFLEVDHDDLWRDISNLLLARPADDVRLTWVKGHASWKDVKQGSVAREDKLGNDYADLLARRGAAQHPPNPLLTARIQNTRLLTKQVQSMMVKIIHARAEESKRRPQQDFDSYAVVPEDQAEVVEISSSSSDDVEIIHDSSDLSEGVEFVEPCAEERPIFRALNFRSGRGPPGAPI